MESALAGLEPGAGAALAGAVARWEAEAAAMLRRLDVVLLTLQGVASERDPAKRLEVSAVPSAAHVYASASMYL